MVYALACTGSSSTSSTRSWARGRYAIGKVVRYLVLEGRSSCARREYIASAPAWCCVALHPSLRLAQQRSVARE